MSAWWNWLSARAWVWRAAAIAGSAVGGLLLFVLFCLYTPPGHHVLAALIEPLSGGEVAVEGLSGTPNHLRARKVEVRDSAGTWLTGEGVRLDWHVWSALGSHIRIDRLAADRIVVIRRKILSKTSTGPNTTVIDIGAIALHEITLDPPVLGRHAVLSAAGKLRYLSRHDMAGDLSIRRLDGAGRYEIHAVVVSDIARGAITVNENGAGLAGGIVGLPDLGAVTLDVRAGAQGSANSIRFSLNAGLLDVSGGGTLDLKAKTAGIDFSAVAPAMTPSKALSWSSISARGHLHGAFARPAIDVRVKIAALSASGIRVAALDVALDGTGGKARLKGTLTGLRLPGEKAGVFAAAPVEISADADLAAPDRPVTFALAHPLLKASGRTTTHLPMTGSIGIDAPTLAGLAPLTGLKIDGTANLNAAFRRSASKTTVTANGRIAAKGDTAIARLVGNAKIDAAATTTPAGLTLEASLAAAAVKADVRGTSGGGRRAFAGKAVISDLSRLVPTLIGTLDLRASLTGPADNGTLTLQATALAATKGMAKQGVSFTAEASGMPNLKAAHVRAAGRFDGSPVSVKADVAAASAKAWTVDIIDATWRSAYAKGLLTIAGNAPQGTVTLHIARLGDLAPLVGSQLSGSLDARSEFRGNSAVVHASVENLAAGGTEIGRIDLGGTIADPFGTPSLGLDASLAHFSADAVSGSAEAHIKGPLDAIALSAKAAMTTSNGQPFTVAADAIADTKARHATISRFEGVWRDQTVTLAAPASLDYADGLKFAATFTEAKAMQLTVVGTIPAKAPMIVKANGTADLAVLLSGLAAVGQNVRGKIAVNVAVTGTIAKPNVIGEATLTGGQIQDFSRGISLTDVEAQATAEGPDIRLSKFTAKAGAGTISGSGSIDLSAKGIPVDITFKASNARPVASDLVTANLDSELKLQGHLRDGLRLSGTLNIREATINVPEKFSREVATLNVRRTHQPAPPPPSAATPIVLDLTLVSPGRIFVRGRGVEAEFEGSLKIAGTTNAPQVQGALELRRGTYSLAGTILSFTSGTIGFNGQALRKRIDPSLDLVAQSLANGITATLKVTGTASQPKIALSSSPQLPQDEILAQLLFQQSFKSLSPMQLASVAQAAAALSGGGGIDPVGTVRRSLGLDRLAVGSSQSRSNGASSTTIEVGKYVLRNVYIGAQQDLSGGTKATVQVDLTKHLKAQAQVYSGPRAAATTSAPLQDNGDSIGLSYQFDY